MARVRVVVLINQLGVGGGERQLVLFLANLDRDRFEPIVLTFNYGKSDYHEAAVRDLGVPLVGVPDGGLTSRLIGLARTLTALRPRIVHAWDTVTNPAAAWAGALARCPARIGSIRSNLFWEGRTSFDRWVARAGLGRILCNSSQGRRDLIALGFPAERTDVVFNSVEIPTAMSSDRRAELRRLWGVPDGACAVCIVGSLKPVKNQALLLAAQSCLPAGREPLHVVLLGEGPDRQRLQELAAELGLSRRVHFVGAIPDAARIVGAFDILCLTSTTEGMPGVLLEGAAASLPQVATDVGGARDVIVEGETGCVVPVGDVSALASALDRLRSSPESRAKMGANARRRARELFSPATMAAGVMQYYSRAMEQTRTRAAHRGFAS